MVKGVLDVLLTLPMVLPPTVVGYFLLLLFGAKRPLGIFFMQHFGVKLVMNWYSAIFASIVVAFPLMYRTARGAFESFDETLAWSAQTLGQSDPWIKTWLSSENQESTQHMAELTHKLIDNTTHMYLEQALR